jgi:alpha-N-arabinofuranosidase
MRIAIAPLLLAALAGVQTPPATQRPAVQITVDAAKVEGHISPLLYGQFMEFMYEDIKRGLHAELLRNRGFEEAPNSIGLSRYWERNPDDRIDDYGIAFAWAADVAYPDTTQTEGLINGHSLRIDVKPGNIASHGVHQSGIPIRSSLEYRGYLWVKAEAFTGDVEVALEADRTGGRVYGSARITGIAGDWRKYPFSVKSSTSDPLARFAIRVTGTGTLWIDQVSLIPGDAVHDLRPDVLERVKALHPAFIRWPGGNVAQDYHWQWGIGPRDARPTWINLSWKNEPESSDFGTDEFVRFAHAIGAAPSITVNVDGRGATPEEAAAWVEYCNGGATSTYGKLRAANGHPEPFGVKYWEIGNEIWGDWVRGHSDAATYGKNFNRYVAAMRAVDPSIQVIGVGDNDMAWNRTVLQLATERMEFLALHHYYGQKDIAGDFTNLMARPLQYERAYGDIAAVLQQVPADRRPRLAINEWGLDLPESQQYSMLGALYGARLMNVFERQSDLVGMSAVSDLVNGWPGGIIQASRHGLFVTPIYLVNRLYATHVGTTRIAATVDGPTQSTSKEGSDVPLIDVVATRAGDGRVFLKVVNTDLKRSHTADVTIDGGHVASRAIVERIVSDSIASVSGFTTPDAVHATKTDLPAGHHFTLTLPRHSVSVVTLTIGN